MTRTMEPFGVSEMAERVYFAMLSDTATTVDDLIDRLDLDEPIVRTALDELGRLSLLCPSHDDPRALRAISPEAGLERLLVHQETELLAHQHRIQEARAALNMISADLAPRTPAARGDMEDMIGIDAIRRRLETLAFTADQEVCTFVPDGAQTEANLQASRYLDERTLARGVRVRTIYLDSIRNDPTTLAYARSMVDRGAEIRTRPTLPIRMIIADRKFAVIPIDPDDTGAGASVIWHKGAVHAHADLFEQYWRQAIPIGTTPPPQSGLAPDEATVLALLARGETDKLAARRMGVSARTVGRIVSEISAAVSVRSRFQLGAAAVVRGWIDADDLA